MKGNSISFGEYSLFEIGKNNSILILVNVNLEILQRFYFQ